MFEGVIPSSQALADRVVAAGYVGMLVRSFAGGASPDNINLALWSWSSREPRRVTLIDDEGRLSRGPAS